MVGAYIRNTGPEDLPSKLCVTSRINVGISAARYAQNRSSFTVAATNAAGKKRCISNLNSRLTLASSTKERARCCAVAKKTCVDTP